MKSNFRKTLAFERGYRYGFSLTCVFASCLMVASSAQANYRTKAIEATNFIQKSMYDSKVGLYHPGIPADPKALPYDFMWGNGVQFSVLTAAATQDPTHYRPALDAFFKGLDTHWDRNPQPFPLPGYDAYFSSRDGNDKYYDDNAWMVLGFTEAYRNTKDPKYLARAKETFQFILSGYDTKLGGGIYWYQNKRVDKNTCINAPAAVGALAIYALDPDPRYLGWAKHLYNWTNKHLQDEDGLFWDNINLQGKVNTMKWTYNSALMIRANLDFWKVTKDAKYLQEARRISDASITRWVNPTTGAMADSARFNHLLCEALLQTYEATKDVKYLNVVRRHADFGYRYVRDITDGGYWNKWDAVKRPEDDQKTLIENASAARLFWLLTPYPDLEQLNALAVKATRAGEMKAALNYYSQAVASTAGTEGIHPLEKPKAKVAPGPAN